MNRIKDRSVVPSGGMAIYVDRDTGIKLAHPYYGQVERMAVKHRRANNLPIPAGFFELVEDNICQNTPGIECIEQGEREFPITKVQTVKKFIRAMIQWAGSGFKLVSPEVFAERRTVCQGDEVSIPKCEWWRGEKMFGYGMCGKCGCTTVKLFLATEACPKQKWKI